jgi:subtilisin family serine protease
MTGLLPRGTSLGLALSAMDAGRSSRPPVGTEVWTGTDQEDQASAAGVPGLAALMALSPGRREVTVALVDGPVDVGHPDLMSEHIVELPGRLRGTCARVSDAACAHGTSVAGILAARRSSPAPGICPGCTLIVRPIFAESAARTAAYLPAATPEDLAEAVIDVSEAGARLINLSIALRRPSPKVERELGAVLDHAVRRGVVIVAAAGNQGMLGSSAITRHRGVIPVVAGDANGRPTNQSNLSHSVGRCGLTAPGDGIFSLAAGGGTVRISGTSAAAPFVTGTIALLLSHFPTATAALVKHAVTRSYRSARKTVAPPPLDASAAYRFMTAATAGREW